MQCGQALTRAARGGLLSGPGLQAVASLLLGAAKLQRAVKAAAREADATGYLGLLPVTVPFKDIATLPELSSAVGQYIDEAGGVRESASEEVRRARTRVRTIEGRIRGILKVSGEALHARVCVACAPHTRPSAGSRRAQMQSPPSCIPPGLCLQGYNGEITEQSGRMCVAVPASPDGPPKGILLGSGPGGSTWCVPCPPAPAPRVCGAALHMRSGPCQPLRFRFPAQPAPLPLPPHNGTPHPPPPGMWSRPPRCR